jgi:hypothetical protein
MEIKHIEKQKQKYEKKWKNIKTMNRKKNIETWKQNTDFFFKKKKREKYRTKEKKQIKKN